MKLNYMNGRSVKDVSERLRYISDNLLRNIEENSRAPEREKLMLRRFNVEAASKLVGRSKKAIYDAEADGRLPSPDRNAQNRKIGYSLEQLDNMRNVFGTQPYRKDHEDPIVLAISSFKGGVAKTTTATHISQYLSMQGYRVLLLDADPQATSTYIMGINPDKLREEETSYVAFSVLCNTPLKDVVRKTYFHKLDLIPCSLSLYQSEMDNIITSEFSLNHMLRLKQSLEDVKQDYDVVVIDPPPNLSSIGMNILAAMNAAIVPSPALYPDLTSLTTYFTMFERVIERFEEKGAINLLNDYKFIKLLITRYNPNHESQSMFHDAYMALYKDLIIQTPMLYSSALEKSVSLQQTLFEIDRNTRGYGDRTYKRCYQNFEQACEEVETEIRKTWPSHHAGLIKEKKITADEAQSITGVPIDKYPDHFAA